VSIKARRPWKRVLWISEIVVEIIIEIDAIFFLATA
jgi:hypothetical protein